MIDIGEESIDVVSESVETDKIPLPMQYLGGKGRIVKGILDELEKNFDNATCFIDLFTGSGVVAYNAMLKGYTVYANDLQPYSSVLVSSLLSYSTNNLESIIDELTSVQEKELFNGSRYKYYVDYLQELVHIDSLGSSHFTWNNYKEFSDSTSLFDGDEKDIEILKKDEQWTLFLAYYRNTYFGVRQCAEIDFLREYSEKLDEDLKGHLMAAVISSLSYCVSSTTHLAQFLKPTSKKNTVNLLKKRTLSIIENVIKRLKKVSNIKRPKNGLVYNLDFSEALKSLNLNSSCLVYADPPYFKEHYSRYYHILDTFVLYDYPKLTHNKTLGKTTIGRYRENRLISDFGKKSVVREAFNELLDSCKAYGNKLAISYACSSLVKKDFFVKQAKERDLNLKIIEFELTHTGQGKSRHKQVIEYLFLFSDE